MSAHTHAGLGISVIVSSYNYERYLAEALDSVLAQTLAPLEVIVVDDGSTDGSVELLRSRYGNEPRVRVFQQANGGQLSAWVRAAGEVHGEIVALMDSDDLWKPHYLERLAAQYARDPSVDLIYCNMELFGIRQGLFHRSRRDRDLGLSILMGAFINRWQGSATSAISLRAPLFRRLVDLPPEQVKQWKSRPDDCLLCGADILGAHKYYVAEPLVMHREHAENALAGYGKSRLAKMRYVVRNEQMLEHYRRLMHITPRWQRLAKHEFKTRQRPGFGEFLDYSRMLGDAPMSFSKRLSHRVSMLAHYLRSLLSGK